MWFQRRGEILRTGCEYVSVCLNSVQLDRQCSTAACLPAIIINNLARLSLDDRLPVFLLTPPLRNTIKKFVCVFVNLRLLPRRLLSWQTWAFFSSPSLKKKVAQATEGSSVHQKGAEKRCCSKVGEMQKEIKRAQCSDAGLIYNTLRDILTHCSSWAQTGKKDKKAFKNGYCCRCENNTQLGLLFSVLINREQTPIFGHKRCILLLKVRRLLHILNRNRK